MDRPGVRQVPEGSGEQGEKWRKLVVKSSMVPQRPSQLRVWWWWWPVECVNYHSGNHFLRPPQNVKQKRSLRMDGFRSGVHFHRLVKGMVLRKIGLIKRVGSSSGFHLYESKKRDVSPLLPSLPPSKKQNKIVVLKEGLSLVRASFSWTYEGKGVQRS